MQQTVVGQGGARGRQESGLLVVLVMAMATKSQRGSAYQALGQGLSRRTASMSRTGLISAAAR
eukprot:3743133-Amphidinium_carterae.1